MHTLRIALLTVVLGLALAGSAAGLVREERRTLVGSEILGRGGLVTFNLEYFPAPNFGLGGGILAAGNGDGGFLILPLYVSIVPGDVHSVYVSGGMTLLGGSDFGDWDSAMVVTGSIGYQYHSYGGLFVRPLFTFMLSPDADGIFLWPGMTIGGSF